MSKSTMGLREIDTISSEKEYQDYLQNQFEERGWDVVREKSPEGSKYRVDLLIRHEHLSQNEWIGIETKYLNTTNSGGRLARAHQQITDQYWDKDYFGGKVDLWAVSPYFKIMHKGREVELKSDRRNKMRAVEAQQFIREFFCKYGIGYLSVSGSYAHIDFGYSIPTHKIPAFGINKKVPNRHYFKSDVGQILNSVRKKRY